MARPKDTQAGESGEYLKMIWENPDLHDADTAPLPTRVGLFDHTEPYGSRLPNPAGTPSPDTTGPDSPTPAAAPEPKKVFNPWKFGRTTLPPGLRRELMLAELPDSPEYVAPEGEGAAAQLEPIATEQVTTDVKSDVVPPTTVRTRGVRSRNSRGRLWTLVPLLGLCFLIGGGVAFFTKRPRVEATSSASGSHPDVARVPGPTEATEPRRVLVDDANVVSTTPPLGSVHSAERIAPLPTARQAVPSLSPTLSSARKEQRTVAAGSAVRRLRAETSHGAQASSAASATSDSEAPAAMPVSSSEMPKSVPTSHSAFDTRMRPPVD